MTVLSVWGLCVSWRPCDIPLKSGHFHVNVVTVWMPLKPPVLAGFPHRPPAEEKEGTASLLAGGDRSLGPTVLWRHGSSVWVGLSAAGAGAVASLCLVSQLPGRCVWVPRNGAGRPYTELVSELGVSSDHQGLRIQR